MGAFLGRHVLAIEDNLDASALTARFLVGTDGSTWGQVTEGMGVGVALARVPA